MLLALNTASSHTCIALSGIAERSWPSDNTEAEKLMPEIDKLLSAHSLTYKDLTHILAISGPGSFTGLRIGVTVANTLAHLTGAALYELNTFEYWWHAIPAVDALLVYAGKHAVYLQRRGNEPEIVPLRELAEKLKYGKIASVSGDITSEQKEYCGNAQWIQPALSCGQIIEKIDLHTLRPITLIHPNYIKPPGITTPKAKV